MRFCIGIETAAFVPPAAIDLHLEKVEDLRYGENPHQAATFYGDLDGLFEKLNGKEISYNNLLDIDAAVNLIGDFDETTFAILKHNNACGIAFCSRRPSSLIGRCRVLFFPFFIFSFYFLHERRSPRLPSR